MRLVQFQMPDSGRHVGLVEGGTLLDLTEQNSAWGSVYAIFRLASCKGRTIEEEITVSLNRERACSRDYAGLLKASPGDPAGWLLPPLDHPQPACCHVGGTGLTHLGSTAQRDAMHKTSSQPRTDSQRMFEMGLTGGKPLSGQRGVPPECFYKGSGVMLRGYNHSLDIPSFADDCGEEPEIVGCYVIGDDGWPYRLGFAIGNEWSDHAMERVNYLWLAPSKLRTCGVGPELITDHPFHDTHGNCTITRNGAVLYESGELLTGEKNMSHSLANLEDHHFKHPQFRVPGDVHIYFFGTMKLSYGHRDRLQDGDRIEISFTGMGAPLVNHVRRLVDDDGPVVAKKG